MLMLPNTLYMYINIYWDWTLLWKRLDFIVEFDVFFKDVQTGLREYFINQVYANVTVYIAHVYTYLLRLHFTVKETSLYGEIWRFL